MSKPADESSPGCKKQWARVPGLQPTGTPGSGFAGDKSTFVQFVNVKEKSGVFGFRDSGIR